MYTLRCKLTKEIFVNLCKLYKESFDKSQLFDCFKYFIDIILIIMILENIIIIIENRHRIILFPFRRGLRMRE